MKKFVLAGLLALPVAAVVQQEACAWCKFNAAVGANVGFASGGSKSILWGAYTSSDVGGIPPHGGVPGPDLGQFGCAGGGAASFGGYGMGPSGYPADGGAYGPAMEMGPPPPMHTPPVAPKKAADAAPAAYQPTDFGSYSIPAGYYYQNPGYGYSQASGFWYGN